MSSSQLGVAPSVAEPEVLIIRGSAARRYVLSKPTITIGRRPDRDIVIPEPYVSRDHARIEVDGAKCFIIDQNSSHGTYVNGERVQRRQLCLGDRIDFGQGSESYVVFGDEAHHAESSDGRRELLSRVISQKESTTHVNELQTLRLFIEAARALNTTGVLSDVLATLVEASLRLTQAERGFVFLCKEDGELELAIGRTEKGDVLETAAGISQSVLNEAFHSASEFVLSAGDPTMEQRESIVAHDLRAIVCIPLRRSKFRGVGCDQDGVMGVLYLDSRFAAGKLPAVSHELIRTIAREAAALVENAYLAKAEQEAQAYQKELAIASTIQQSLMEVKIPRLEFAEVEARNISCKEIGGDFYDVIQLRDSVAVVLADVSGKGVSAALLAAVLQGAIYPQLQQGLPLAEMASAMNMYIYDKIVGRKYATMVMLKLHDNGTLEYINCGHVKPILRNSKGIQRLENGNLPVGLLAPATFSSETVELEEGDELILMTDGVLEAENQSGEFFGDDRAESVLSSEFTVAQLFTGLTDFRESTPLFDDCTALRLKYCRIAEQGKAA